MLYKVAVEAIIVVSAFAAGIVVQQIHDEIKAPITVNYGASFAYAHVYMPPCVDGQYRVVDGSREGRT